MVTHNVVPLHDTERPAELWTGHDGPLQKLRAAVQQAYRAQEDWARTPVGQRCDLARRARDWVVSNADLLAATIARNTSKTMTDALSTEVLPAAMAAEYFARRAPGLLRDRRLGAGNLLFAYKRSRVRRLPLGVIGIVAPWNYPFVFPFTEVIMALLAGNAVVLRSATESRTVGRLLERCLLDAGLPDGLFTAVNLPDEISGEAFLTVGVDKLLFTGSAAAGKRLSALAAETLTPLCLRLGGNDPMLVCPDADVERAAAGAVWAGMQSYGRSQSGVRRIYVHRQVHRLFLNHLVNDVRLLRLGRGDSTEVDVGVISHAASLEMLRSQIEEALSKGAVIEGEPEDLGALLNRTVPPTVLSRVNHDMRIMREQIWGPVVGVMLVENMDQAVRLANDSELALTASVWSRHRSQARALAERLEAGVVTINDHQMSYGLAETPWGGFKRSGLGRSHGELGFVEMTEPQCIVDDLLPGVKRDLWWHPHEPEVYAGLRGMLDMLYAPRLRQRLGGMQRLTTLLPRMFDR